jgi:TP901 family phage tail tape measure protein
MADDSSNLGLGVLLTGDAASALAALTSIEQKLKSLVSGMEKVTSTFNKSSEEQIKSQTKIADAVDKSAKAMGDAATGITNLSSNAAKASDKLTDATKKQGIANEALGISLKDARKQLEGLNGAQQSQIYSSTKSKEMFNAISSELKKFKGSSYEARNAIVDMAKASDNNVMRFKQLSGALEKVEKSIMQTKETMGKMGMPTNEINAFAKGVDRAAASSAFLNGEMYKSGNILLSASKSFVGLNKETEVLATKYQKLINSNTAYGKQAADLIEKSRTTTDGFKLLGTQLDNVNKAWKESTVGMDAWNKASAKVGTGSKSSIAVVNQLSEEIKKGNIGYKEATAKLNEHLAAVDKTGPSVGRFGQFVAGLHSKFTGMAATINNATGYFYNLGHAIVSMATWIPAAMFISAITTAITGAIESVKDFDQALKNLQAISGGTEAEIELLGEEILKISTMTKFSASEIAKGAVYIAQAGFSAAESLKVIGAAALGAQGTLEPLTTAADLLTTVIRSFKLEASEASYIMDALAAAANGSKTNLEGMKTVFNYIGPTAKAAGASLNETLGAIMALSNAGIRMSTVGTSLRQIFIGLENPNRRLAAAMNNAGLTAKDFSVKSLGLVAVLKNLNTVIGGDLSNATQFFNVRANNAALVLSTMHEYVGLLIDDTKRYGVAQIMAGTQLDSISGKMDMLANRFKAMLITFSQGGITDVFKGLLDVLMGVVNFFNGALNNSITKTLLALAAFGVAITVVVTLLGKLAAFTGLVTLWNAITAAVAANTVATGANAVAQGGLIVMIGKVRAALAALWAMMMAHPIIAAIAIISALIVTYINWKKSADDVGISIQKQAIENNNLAVSAESLANKLDDLAKAEAEGKNTTENYLSIMQQVRDLYPELSSAMAETNGNYKAQAELLKEQVLRYKEATKASVEKIAALNNEKFAFSESLVSQGRYLVGSKLLELSMREQERGFKSLAKLLKWIGDYYVEAAGKMDSYGLSTDAAIKADHAMIVAAQEMAASISLLDEKEQQLILTQLQGTETYKKLVAAKVATSNMMKKALLANDDQIMESETFLLDQVSAKWNEYYQKQSATNKTWLLKIYAQAIEAGKKAQEAYAKSSKEAQEDDLGQRKAFETAFNEVVSKSIDERAKIYERELAALKKHTEEKLKLLKKSMDMELSLLNMEESMAVNQARKNENTTENAEEAEYRIHKNYVAKKINLLEEYYVQEEGIIQEGFEARKRIIEQDTLYLETSDSKKEQYLENEKNRSDQLVTLYDDQLKAYESMANSEISNMTKLESSAKAHATKMKSLQNELTQNSMDANQKRLSAYKLTMSDEQKMAADVQMHQEVMSEGYRELYAGNTAAAKDYFEKAGGMIDSLSVKTTDVFGKESEDAQATQKLRLGLISEYENAKDSAIKKEIEGEARAASAELEKYEKSKRNLQEFYDKIKEVKEVISKEMAVNLNVTTALEKLKELQNKTKEPNEVVLKFMGEASPKDTLENTINGIKSKLDGLKTYLSTQTNSQLVIQFLGTMVVGVIDAIPSIIDSIRLMANKLSVDLTNSVTNFLVQFVGNDGSGSNWIMSVISKVWSEMQSLSNKINSLRTVHTIVTKHVTEGAPAASGSSGSGEATQYAEGGGVPGTGDSDSVPAMLTPGEFVIRKSVVGALGESFFTMINGLKNPSIPKFNMGALAFAKGGIVPDKKTETFTLNLAVGSVKVPLQVMGDSMNVRKQIKLLEKELSKMRLAHA